MTVHELNRDQLIELKQHYLTETQDSVGYSDLMDADDLVPDSVVYGYYAGYSFSPDDFFSSAGEDEEEDNYIYQIHKRVGSPARGWKEGIIEGFGSIYYNSTLKGLREIADLFNKDSRCFVDWLGESAFCVNWTTDYVTEYTERWIYSIQGKWVKTNI